MILTILGLSVASVFSGAALYINWSEQPARMKLDDASLLKVWKPSYAKGFEMQATLAVVGGVLGISSFVVEHSYLSLLGGVLMLANWPWTLLAIMPTNKRLEATSDDRAGPDTRALIVQWGKLHAVRTAFGLAGASAFLAAAILGS